MEGTKESFDTELYQTLLSDFKVMPVGSCQKVIEMTKGLRGYTENSHVGFPFKIFGLIDRDRRAEHEISALKEHGVYTLCVAEVENLFCTEGLIKYLESIPEYNASGALKETKKFVFDELRNALEHQVCQHAANEMRHKLSLLNENAKNRGALKENFEQLVAGINVPEIIKSIESQFNAVLKSKDYDALLKIYNRKSLPTCIGRNFGWVKGTLPRNVIHLAKQPEHKESILKALIPYLGNFSEVIEEQRAAKCS